MLSQITFEDWLPFCLRYHFNYAATFFNYTHILGRVSCAASANSPIQDLKAGEEHLIKKGYLSVAFTDPTLVSWTFQCEAPMGASSFTLICAVLLLKQEQEEPGHHTSPSPLLFLGQACSLWPKTVQDKTRSNWTHLWYCVRAELCWFFSFFQLHVIIAD